MAVLRSRSRLVTFRLDPEEYAELRRVAIKTGARSMSEFARVAVLEKFNSSGGSLAGDIATVTTHLKQLETSLTVTREVVRRALGVQEQI